MGDGPAAGGPSAPEWARVSAMEPFGVRVDVRTSTDGGGEVTTGLLEDRTAVAELGALLKRLMDAHALVVVTGLLVEAGFSPEVMDNLMDDFGPKELNITFDKTPLVDGDDLLADSSCEMPNHPAIRILGNGRDAATGKPNALLANVGYVFHQDASEPYDCTSFLVRMGRTRTSAAPGVRRARIA